MTRTFLALIFLLLTAVACPAGQHPLTVTRTADDFYAAFDRDILIKTKFCSVRAFQEKALLRSDLFGELVFMDGTRCSVDTVYVRKRLRWGTHKVTVTREEEPGGLRDAALRVTLLHAGPAGRGRTGDAGQPFRHLASAWRHLPGGGRFRGHLVLMPGPAPAWTIPRKRRPGLPGFPSRLRACPAGGWGLEKKEKPPQTGLRRLFVFWYPEPGLNRHSRWPRDFKSLVSTNSTIRAWAPL